jgi:hypothetical protein
MVGAVFLALILVVLAAYIWLRWKLRSWTEKLSSKMEDFVRNFNPGVMGLVSVPPMRIKLSPATVAEAAHPDDLERITLELQALGFQRGELFNMGDIGGVCRAMFHPQHNLEAVVSDHLLLSVWVEFVAWFADGTELTYSNAQQPSKLDPVPGHESRSFPGEQVAVLWERFKNDLPAKPRAAVDPKTFAERFEQAYRDEMDWRISRGGVTEDEIRRCGGTDDEGVNERLIQTVQSAWQMRIAQHFDEELRNAFLQGESMSLADYESQRNRLVFIHDHTAPEQLLMYTQAGLDDESDDEDDSDDGSGFDDGAHFTQRIKMRQRCQAASPRAVFRELLAARELRGDFRHIKALTDPCPADVYVASSEF